MTIRHHGMVVLRTWFVAALGALAIVGTSHAAPISPGFDHFSAPPGLGTFVLVDTDNDGNNDTQVDLEGNPAPIPPGFFSNGDFFPGVDPFPFFPAPFDSVSPEGQISLEGGGSGPTDTIIERLGPVDPTPGNPATVEIELVALSLQSVAPVDIQGTLFDVEVIGGSALLPLQPPPTQPSFMTIFKEDPNINGGTFNWELHVVLNLIFIEVGNLQNTFSELRIETFLAEDAQWAGAVIPVPAALPLLLSGLVGLGLIGWRRRTACA